MNVFVDVILYHKQWKPKHKGVGRGVRRVYSIQHYVIMFVSNMRQIDGFHRVSSMYTTECHEITEILLKIAL